MRRRLGALVVLALAALVVGALPASAITFGQLDGSLHPSTGALVADWDPTSPGPDELCTGTLISQTVFLTAGHCTDFLESEGITQAWVSFAPVFDEDAANPGGLLPGTWTTDPDYGYSGQGGNSDPHDLAVFVFNSPVAGIAPAQLPTANLLDTMKKQLSRQTFTAVGYGIARDTKKTGPHAFTYDGARRYAFQTFSSLTPAWITYSMNPSTGDAGGCFGDSGGPHFLGGAQSNLIVSITVTGDSVCRATDKTYRLDTPSTRNFLDDFVTLP
jgi:trypsin